MYMMASEVERKGLQGSRLSWIPSPTLLNAWGTTIQLFDGRIVNPEDFPLTQAGFQDYLSASNVRYFSAKEMTTPNQKDTARRLGYEILLPRHEIWPRGVALAKLADHLRTILGRPIVMRNWWRPSAYNQRVRGKKNSDHIGGYAVDLDYRSVDDRRRAERALKEIRERYPWLRMSLGLGYRTTHVGLFSPKGAREWRYTSYKP